MARRKKRTFTLRQAREYAGLKIGEAADKVGVHYQTLRNWELGRFNMTTEELTRLLKVYNMHRDEIEL